MVRRNVGNVKVFSTMQRCCAPLDYFCNQILKQVFMKKDKKQKRKEIRCKKGAVESLRFQMYWGLKQLGIKDGEILYQQADAELESILALDLAQELLSIKVFIDTVKQIFSVEPVANKGDFIRSIVAIALGIAKLETLGGFETPSLWNDLIRQKMLAVYYPDEVRNSIIAWAKQNTYNTSTYLGHPIVKFNQIYLVIKRAK